MSEDLEIIENFVVFSLVVRILAKGQWFRLIFSKSQIVV